MRKKNNQNLRKLQKIILDRYSFFIILIKFYIDKCLNPYFNEL